MQPVRASDMQPMHLEHSSDGEQVRPLGRTPLKSALVGIVLFIAGIAIGHYAWPSPTSRTGIDTDLISGKYLWDSSPDYPCISNAEQVRLGMIPPSSFWNAQYSKKNYGDWSCEDEYLYRKVRLRYTTDCNGQAKDCHDVMTEQPDYEEEKEEETGDPAWTDQRQEMAAFLIKEAARSPDTSASAGQWYIDRFKTIWSNPDSDEDRYQKFVGRLSAECQGRCKSSRQFAVDKDMDEDWFSGPNGLEKNVFHDTYKDWFRLRRKYHRDELNTDPKLEGMGLWLQSLDRLTRDYIIADGDIDLKEAATLESVKALWDKNPGWTVDDERFLSIFKYRYQAECGLEMGDVNDVGPNCRPFATDCTMEIGCLEEGCCCPPDETLDAMEDNQKRLDGVCEEQNCACKEEGTSCTTPFFEQADGSEKPFKLLKKDVQCKFPKISTRVSSAADCWQDCWDGKQFTIIPLSSFPKSGKGGKGRAQVGFMCECTLHGVPCDEAPITGAEMYTITSQESPPYYKSQGMDLTCDSTPLVDDDRSGFQCEEFCSQDKSCKFIHISWPSGKGCKAFSSCPTRSSAEKKSVLMEKMTAADVNPTKLDPKKVKNYFAKEEGDIEEADDYEE